MPGLSAESLVPSISRTIGAGIGVPGRCDALPSWSRIGIGASAATFPATVRRDFLARTINPASPTTASRPRNPPRTPPMIDALEFLFPEMLDAEGSESGELWVRLVVERAAEVPVTAVLVAAVPTESWFS